MSPRARAYVLVAAAAAAAAAATVGAVLLQAGNERAADSPQPPPLELGVLVGDDRQARALRAAERAYDRGDREAALERFEAILRRDPSSVEAAVGAALASWPTGTVARLEQLAAEHPSSGVVRLHLGLALFARGDREAAVEQWREAERSDPDSPAAVAAESLRHPEMPPGRPYFHAPLGLAPQLEKLPPERLLAALGRRARADGVEAWLLYGAALQRAGRPVSARAAFDRAAAADPDDIDARTAAAVGRFDKDEPSEAFSRLGPLARAQPRSPVVRFHLGLLLLWLGDVEDARRQLRLAREAAPRSVYGREASRLLARLREI